MCGVKGCERAVLVEACSAESRVRVRVTTFHSPLGVCVCRHAMHAVPSGPDVVSALSPLSSRAPVHSATRIDFPGLSLGCAGLEMRDDGVPSQVESTCAPAPRTPSPLGATHAHRMHTLWQISLKISKSTQYAKHGRVAHAPASFMRSHLSRRAAKSPPTPRRAGRLTGRAHGGGRGP